MNYTMAYFNHKEKSAIKQAKKCFILTTCEKLCLTKGEKCSLYITINLRRVTIMAMNVKHNITARWLELMYKCKMSHITLSSVTV